MKLDFLKRIRKNHALEHATISIAHSRMEKPGILAGNSTQGGFFVYGDVPTEVLSQAASEALERLKAGESHMAISPFCGTNLVVTATLTGLATALALGNQFRWRKMPGVIRVTLAALLISRPVGHLVQKHVTTDGDIGGMEIKGISHIGTGALTVHRVRTSS
ncbi:MAG: hypothetical protein HYX93_05875 [Chloroflexi bacterium]|nr:hypothetical protein [Chloroflexota bacterium]